MYEGVLMKSEHHVASIEAICSINDDISTFHNKMIELSESNIYEPELLLQITNLINSIDSKLNIFTFYLKNAKTECLNNISALSDSCAGLICECLWINNQKDQSLITGFCTDLRPLNKLSFTNIDCCEATIDIEPITDESAYSFLSIWNFIRNIDDTIYENLFRISKMKFDCIIEEISHLLLVIRDEIKPILHSPRFTMDLSIPDKKDIVISDCNIIISRSVYINEKIKAFENVIKNIHNCEVALYENQDIFYAFYSYSMEHKSIAYAPESSITLI